MEAFDLEGAATARAEAHGEGFAFEMRGTTFTMVPIGEFEYDWLAILDADLPRGLDLLLGPQAEKFHECRPKVLEVTMLRDQVVTFYSGIVAGEPAASAVSSRNISRRSRPSSKPTTAST